MSWPSTEQGWELGQRDGGTGVLLGTTDAGATWTPNMAVDASGAAQVAFADAINGWIVGEGGAMSTHDGGSTWTPVTVPGGISTGAAIAAASGTVHLAYLAGNANAVDIASSPIDHDAFVAAPVSIPIGAGPRLDASMSAGGPYAELVYNDRTFIGAAELRAGRWATWDLTCPYDNPAVVAGLSPQGTALAIACGPSGFGDPAPVVGANLSTGTLSWTTVEPAGNQRQIEPTVVAATATDAGVRIIVLTTAAGTGEISSSSDGGVTWTTRAALPPETSPGALAHLPDGRILLSTKPNGALISADGLTWTSVPTG